jgi:uncharacterized protein (DUF1810 family)
MSAAQPPSPHAADPFDLERFVRAQAGHIDAALRELRAGAKRTHWMWFVFPQLRGLGHSAMAHAYGLAGRAEAEAYLAHPVLGPRLVACTQAVLAVPQGSAHAIFGSPDDLKFQSCMTLFEAVAQGREPVFGQAIERFFDGRRDPRSAV